MSEVETLVIDLTRMDEGFMTMEATKLKLLMNDFFTGSYFPVEVKGNPMQIDRFTRALAAEKNYIAAFNNYGLNNPATYRSRYKLDAAVRRFERDTGLVWPIK